MAKQAPRRTVSRGSEGIAEESKVAVASTARRKNCIKNEMEDYKSIPKAQQERAGKGKPPTGNRTPLKKEKRGSFGGDGGASPHGVGGWFEKEEQPGKANRATFAEG